jgi:hypothetical protein
MASEKKETLRPQPGSEHRTSRSAHLTLARIILLVQFIKLCKKVKVKVKQSRYWPGVAQRVPGSYGSQITWQRHRMVVRSSALHTGRLYNQEMFLVPISVRGWVDPRVIVRSEGLYQWKIPMTPSGIEPATFRFLAQYLNHWATIKGPLIKSCNFSNSALNHLCHPYICVIRRSPCRRKPIKTITEASSDSLAVNKCNHLTIQLQWTL